MGRGLAMATVAVVALLIASAAAVTAASVSHAARADSRVAELQRQAGASASVVPSAGPTARASASPGSSASAPPSGGPDPRIAAAVNQAVNAAVTDVMRTCVAPIQGLAAKQAGRIDAYIKVVNVFGADAWSNQLNKAINSYSGAYGDMRSAAATWENRLRTFLRTGLEPSTGTPGTERSASSKASAGRTAWNKFNDQLGSGKNNAAAIAAGLKGLDKLETVDAASKECPKPLTSAAPSASPAASATPTP
jgi:hypothetical protein